MKNGLLKKMIICVMMVFTLIDAAQAGDNISFSVSCTIPAIPGVNAPPFAEEKKGTLPAQQSVAQETKKEPEETKTEAPPTMIQEDSEETLLAQGKSAIKTIYPR